MITTSWLIGLAVPLRVLTLTEAIHQAETKQPQIAASRAAVQGAAARIDEARSPLLPAVNAQLLYQRATSNYVPRSGAVSIGPAAQANSSLDTYNYFSAGVTLNQTIYDFGQSLGRYRAVQTGARGAEASARTTREQVLLRVRQVYFQAIAQRALVWVARDALDNQLQHQTQVQGFVEVGTRPAIDLAQSRTDVANARLQLINAENSYRTARAELNAAMGVTGSLDYEVEETALSPIAGEDGPVEALVQRAIAARPELASLAAQVAAQEETVRATRAAYWPTLGLSLSLTEEGSELTNLAWNWSAGVLLSWPLLQGGLTRAQVREQRATLDGLRAQSDGQLQQVRLEVVEAHLGIRAAKESVVAAEQAEFAARESLRLAEGRYAAGSGNGVELGDAQIKRTTAASQRVVVSFNLASARARLLGALGEGPTPR